jgi:class 3 adenylate cyclase
MGHRMTLLNAIGARQVSDEISAAAGSSAASLPSTRNAERRQLTVMFCDLVGSVELGEQLDLEDYRDLLGRFRNAVVGAVERSNGFVARHQGDGVLVYFGYPQAHEEDAQQAVRAGLDIVQSVKSLEHPYDVTAAVRVGIATGTAVVGDLLETGASSEQAALGQTPNLAARLQGEAEPNSVVISDTTKALTAGLFEFKVLPARAVKGISDPVTPYQVLTEVRGQSRFAARSGSHLSPFVGREEELELLTRRWSRAKAGRGQVVLTVGEAGIGKSRLMQQLLEHIGTDSHETISVQCSPYHESSALYPVISAFERELEFAQANTEGAHRLAALQRHLAVTAKADELTLGLFAHFLSIPTEVGVGSIEAMDTAQRRERTLQALVDYVRKRAERAPLLCAFEDVHWADPTTRELLGRLVEAIESESVLLIATTRPGFEAQWADLAHVQVLSLSRLGPEAGVELARAVASTMAGLANNVVEAVLSRAEGNPLYIEELTRTMAQSAESVTPNRGIPATLQDSLMARLDASQIGKNVAQCAAVIGREFKQHLLSKVWEGSSERLTEGLNALDQAGLILRRGEGGLAQYIFKHALIRDTAYASY